jgi:hypothetical protein
VDRGPKGNSTAALVSTPAIRLSLKERAVAILQNLLLSEKKPASGAQTQVR